MLKGLACQCVARAPVRNGEAKQQSLEPQLQSWLTNKGLPTQKVDIWNFGEEGRGLRATCRIPKGEQLLRVPASVLLTEDAAHQHSKLGRLLARDDLPTWSTLALFLAEVRSQSRNSDWACYAQALPNTCGCVLEWQEEEVKLLEGSSLQEAAQAILQAEAISMQELQPLVEEAEADGLIQVGAITRKQLRWAFSMLLSRLVRLPALGNVEALVPFADMGNHDPAAKSHLDWDAATASVSLLTDRAFNKGEQVKLSYGTKTTGQLLLSYGFAPAPLDNPHDACPLRLDLYEDDPLYEVKAASLEQHGLEPSQEFPLRMGGLPEGCIQYAAFMDAEPADASEVAELADWLFRRKVCPVLDGVDTQLLGVQVLRDEVQRALKRFPASMEDNQKALQELNLFPRGRDAASQTSQRRKALITGVKLQEQKILNRVAFILLQQKKDLSQ